MAARRRAQQKAVPVIGYLHFAKPGSLLQNAFLQGLKDTGYFAGQNVAIEYRWAEGQYDRSRAMAADLVGRKVDVIAAFGPPIARLAFVIHVTEWNRSRAAIVAHARARRQISYFLKEFQRLCCDWRQLLEPSSGVWNARASEILFLEAIRR